MTTDKEEPLIRSAEEIRQVDALYQPFPSFATWDEGTFVDLVAWDQLTALFEQRRSQFSQSAIEDACNGLLRAAAFDTGAIEGHYKTDYGFTLTVVAHEAIGWEASVASRSDIALPMFRGQLDTYELLLAAVKREIEDFTEVWIRWVHENLCKAYPYYEATLPDGTIAIRDLHLGQYKTEPNHVLQSDESIHAYAPVSETSHEMHRLIEELNSPAFHEAHPITQAAYAHYALVCIHPFQDGNGRVARALASVFLLRALSIPLVILNDSKPEYFAALATADVGNHQEFEKFIQERTFDGISLVLDWLSGSPEDVEGVAASLRKLLVVREGLTNPELDAKANLLTQLIVQKIQQHFADLALPPGLSFSPQITQLSVSQIPQMSGYRAVVQPPGLTMIIHAQSAAPAQANVVRTIPAYVTREPASSAMVFAFQLQETEHKIELRIEEAHPAVTTTAQWRLDQFAQRVVGIILNELLAQAQESLRAAGYVT
jgi:Fic family protein